MKKSRRILLLCGVLLILLCFVGCTQSSVEESDSVSTESQTESTGSVISDLSSDSESLSDQWSGEAYVVDPVDGFGTEDCLLFENETYRMERIDGKCFISFKEGKKPSQLYSGGCVIYPQWVQFGSFADLYRRVAKTGLNPNSLQTIRSFFSPNEEGQYEIVDPYHLTLPVFPGYDQAYYLTMNGSRLSAKIAIPDGVSKYQGYIASMEVSFLEEDQFDEKIDSMLKQNAERAENVFSEADRDATVYDYSTETRWCRDKQYVLQKGNKTLHVFETYSVDREDSPDGAEFGAVPSSVNIFWTDGTTFFRVQSQEFSARPTEEFLLSIRTAPYVPKQ